MRDVVERARAAGVLLNQSLLSQLERGIRNWTSDYIAGVASGLELPVDRLLAEVLEGEPGRLARAAMAGEVDEVLRFALRLGQVAVVNHWLVERNGEMAWTTAPPADGGFLGHISPLQLNDQHVGWECEYRGKMAKGTFVSVNDIETAKLEVERQIEFVAGLDDSSGRAELARRLLAQADGRG